MTSKIKPGLPSLIVFTVVMFIVSWVDAWIERSAYPLLLWICLVVMWWSSWRGRRRLARIEELSAELEANHRELAIRTADLEAAISSLRAASPEPQPAVAAPPAAAAAVAVASQPAHAFSPPEPLVVSAPTPPPEPPHVSGSHAASHITFGQVGVGPAGPSAPSLFQRIRSLLKFEELLGTNWLAKIGALILVLGVAFFLNWVLRNVGPPGKVAVGSIVGAVLLGAGLFFERNERYRIAGRSAIAAGWAIVFFTAYAMNHVEAARVLSSELADLGLMLAVAAGMVLHTLRYRSQVASALAFLSAFAGIFATVFPSKGVTPPDVSSLTAALVLAVGVAWVAVRMQWFVLEICAIAATFLNHFVWLIHIIRPMGKHHHAFAEFVPSVAILGGYWAVYRASYLIRRGDQHERISTLAALLNTGLLLAVMRYQSAHPEYAFWALLLLGSLELGLGQLPQARRRAAPHVVLTVIGASLLFAAIPFRIGLNPHGVSLLWLAMTEAFFLTGVLTRERVFRRVGLFAFVPLSGQLIVEAARVWGARSDGADVKGEFPVAAVCALVALVLYVTAHWAPRRWAAQFDNVIEQKGARDLSYFAGLLALIAGWLAFYDLGAAVAWMALACALAWAGNRWTIRPLQIQSLLLAALAFLRVWTVNLADEGAYHVGSYLWPARLVTTVAAVALCYLAAHWHRGATSVLERLKPLLTWAASAMFTLLMWHELKSAAVALGWGAFALVMLEIGIARNSFNLRLQAYVAGICAFLRLLFVNLNASSPGRLSPRLYTVVPLAVLFFYMFQRLDERGDRLSPREQKIKPVFAWLGTTTLVLLLRFETPLDWVAAGWAATVLAVLALAWWSGKMTFMHQGLVLSLGVLFRGVLHNLYERSYFTPLSPLRSNLSTIAAAAFLFAGLFFAFRLRRQPGVEQENRLVRTTRILAAHPEQVLFFVALALLTAFLGVVLRSGMVTLAWSLEAVVVFVAALWIGERSYRLSGIGLLLLCIGKIFIVDFRHMSVPDKAITFTVVGALILGVSILYSKNRERVRQFL
jgi:uncharacterized membrane protein